VRLIERNCILLHAAMTDKTLEQTNHLLLEREYEKVSEQTWLLWVNYYKPLAESSEIYKKEIVCNDRSLAWLARDLNKEHNKKRLS
jgi:hypothetical protein